MIHASGRIPQFAWAVAARPRSGERISGDRHVVAPFSGGVLVAVVDALGHGGEAAAAARTAAAALKRGRSVPVETLVREVHERLSSTRGVAAAVAQIDCRRAQMTWMAVGNVEGLLVRARGPRGGHPVLQLWGVLGYRFPLRLVGERIDLEAGDRVVFATDGIRGDFHSALDGRPMERQAADVLGGFGLEADDALVLVGEYRGAAL